MLGGLDILVTNAGGPPTGPFEKVGDEDWDTAYQLNLMSAVRLIRVALPALKASGRGRIVNLTGYGVKEPITDLVVSDSLRAGVTVMAKTIATDLAPYGITSTIATTIPVRRMGEPKEIGDLCAYLASAQAGYLTGQSIVVDGGANRSI